MVHSGYWENVELGSDHVNLKSHNDKELILKHEAVASSAEDHSSIGSLGLASRIFSFTGSNILQPSTMHHFIEEHKTLSASYGYTAGAVYKEEPVYGSLTLGGYDTTRSGANNLTFDLWPGIPQDLLVSIEQITTGNESLLVSPIVANIDSSVAQLWLPATACQRFEEVFDLTWSEESNLIFNETSNPNSTIDIVLPYASFDLIASYPLVADAATHYFPLRRAENESQFTLGRTFLQEAYLLVDYDRSLFSISQASFPDPWECQSIVPIYRSSNVVAWHGRFDDDKTTFLYLVASIMLLFWSIILFLYLTYALWGCKKTSYATQKSFRRELQILKASVSRLVHSNLLPDTVLSEVSAFLSELGSVPPSLISIVSQDRLGTINQLKIYIEELTGVDWYWWPLRPREKSLLPNYSRVRWSCACGEEISKDVLTAIADRLGEIISQQKSTTRPTSGASEEIPTGQQNTRSALTTTFSDFDKIPSLYTTSYDASAPSPLGYTNTISDYSMNASLKPEIQDRFVFVGITKGNIVSLVQINVKDRVDDVFFECLKTEYKKCRGLIRRLLGIWRYSHCDFVKVGL
ncbi:hypothetical protein MMC27_003437 [Xylographa pallens]|nr:hypothetical protein [Xylographa pallens]